MVKLDPLSVISLERRGSFPFHVANKIGPVSIFCGCIFPVIDMLTDRSGRYHLSLFVMFAFASAIAQVLEIIGLFLFRLGSRARFGWRNRQRPGRSDPDEFYGMQPFRNSRNVLVNMSAHIASVRE